MRRIIFRTGLVIVASIAFAALPGCLSAAGQTGEAPPANPPAAEQGDSGPTEADIARARETLVELLISEAIDRIDFEAETYDQGMALIHDTVNTILLQYPVDSQNIMVFADQARRVIGALNSHKPRGLYMTLGPNVDRLAVRNHQDARMLGELVGTTVSLIREQYGKAAVAYDGIASKLFRSIILDAEQGPFLAQYLDGIQLIAAQPPAKRDRYFR